MLTTILAAALVLCILIFVHELGHFLTAKLVDIEVPRFSIGFGPKVLGFRRGETEYVISALPLGGYVKMAGMEEMEGIEGADDELDPARRGPDGRRLPGPRDFEAKSLPARALVISAGVIMNLIFAFAAFATIGMVWGVPRPPQTVIGNIVEERLPEGAAALASVPRMSRLDAIGSDTVRNFEDLQLVIATTRSGPTEFRFAGLPPVTVDVPSNDSAKSMLSAAFEPVSPAPPVLSDVEKDGPAGRAGLEAGDRVLSANGKAIDTWQEFGAAIEASPDKPLDLTVLRGTDTVAVTVVPEAREMPSGVRSGRIGVSATPAPLPLERQRIGPTHAVIYGFTETTRWVGLTIDFVYGMITHRVSARQIGGPIMIAQISGEAARAGLEALLNFMALLSVNLAILNLLPIPVLDGGHLLFILVEAVRGRPVSVEQRIRWTKVGFIVILALMTFAIGNDLVRWIGL